MTDLDFNETCGYHYSNNLQPAVKATLIIKIALTRFWQNNVIHCSTTKGGTTITTDWLTVGLSLKERNMLFIFCIVFYPNDTIYYSLFSFEMPSGQIGGAFAYNIINNSEDERLWRYPSPSFCLFSFPLALLLIYAQHECLGDRVCGLNLYECLPDGGQRGPSHWYVQEDSG